MRVQLAAGSALAVSCERLRAASRMSATLLAALVRFDQTFALQVSRTLLATLHTALEVRLACWLLMFHDRVDGDEIVLTHSNLAELLHARRASITDALHILEGERALHCTRGRIVVRDRARLESCAAGAYGAPERAYRRTIGPFGKTQRTGRPAQA